MSIRNKILLSIVVSVFVAVACASGIVYQRSGRNALEDFKTSSSEQLRLANDYMALLMRDARGITGALSALPVIRGGGASDAVYGSVGAVQHRRHYAFRL